ncbi:hypothetical protein ACRE_018400 [Hapsidospora chrysogenum ATCC 11550]|uniref:Uncharacterized protein n=1 Tax=Hapsidospora chrysogenum (strain ATCC 11550 / CBS 779.69 / DSM 880 / IAM 14645 / JCM 23072 / IMI 49137) TaxID=857340 RepID=A0A086TCX2_HAPC1|nr:hypothetical protein ACRE_018400 [Hapsidospora chrysogenum ATCC 11550]
MCYDYVVSCTCRAIVTTNTKRCANSNGWKSLGQTCPKLRSIQPPASANKACPRCSGEERALDEYIKQPSDRARVTGQHQTPDLAGRAIPLVLEDAFQHHRGQRRETAAGGRGARGGTGGSGSLGPDNSPLIIALRVSVEEGSRG